MRVCMCKHNVVGRVFQLNLRVNNISHVVDDKDPVCGCSVQEGLRRYYLFYVMAGRRFSQIFPRLIIAFSFAKS